MSKPRYLWWGFVRRMIRVYPIQVSALRDLHAQSITAKLSGMPGGGGTGRSVENTALRPLPGDTQKMHDAVARAIEIMRLRPDSAERLALIRLMYWVDKPLTAKAAALPLHISECTAKRWHGDFVRLVAKCYGFDVDTPEPK